MTFRAMATSKISSSLLPLGPLPIAMMPFRGKTDVVDSRKDYVLALELSLE